MDWANWLELINCFYLIGCPCIFQTVVFCLHKRGVQGMKLGHTEDPAEISVLSQGSTWLVQELYVSFYLKLLGLLLFVEREFEWSKRVGPMPGLILSQYATTL